jgi:putative transposase
MYENHMQFFTATILEWKKLLRYDWCKDIITSSLAYLVKENRVTVYAFVIMPNHIHLIWRIDENRKREDVQRDFLKYTAQRIKSELMVHHPAVLKHFEVKAKDREYQIWERNPLSIDILNNDVLFQKLDYLHNNPIQDKWQLCASPEDYIYSSARFYECNQSTWTFLTHWNE